MYVYIFSYYFIELKHKKLYEVNGYFNVLVKCKTFNSNFSLISGENKFIYLLFYTRDLVKQH